MKNEQQPQREWEEIIDLMIDGEPTPEDVARLEKVLRTSPEARRDYQITMQLVANLESTAFTAESAEIVPGLPSQPEQRGKVRNLGWLVKPMPAALVACFAGVIGFFLGQLYLSGKPAPPDAPGLLAAEIGRLDQVQWEDKQWAGGQPLQAGDQVEILKGRAELVFAGGAHGVLSGPGSLSVTSKTSCQLFHGKFHITSPPGSQFFLLGTPAGAVTGMRADYGENNAIADTHKQRDSRHPSDVSEAARDSGVPAAIPSHAQKTWASPIPRQISSPREHGCLRFHLGVRDSRPREHGCPRFRFLWVSVIPKEHSADSGEHGSLRFRPENMGVCDSAQGFRSREPWVSAIPSMGVRDSVNFQMSGVPKPWKKSVPIRVIRGQKIRHHGWDCFHCSWRRVRRVQCFFKDPWIRSRRPENMGVRDRLSAIPPREDACPRFPPPRFRLRDSASSRILAHPCYPWFKIRPLAWGVFSFHRQALADFHDSSSFHSLLIFHHGFHKWERMRSASLIKPGGSGCPNYSGKWSVPATLVAHGEIGEFSVRLEMERQKPTCD